MLVMESFAGKSAVLFSLMWFMASLGKAGFDAKLGWVGGVPILPLFVEFNKLAPLLAGGRRGEP